MVKNIKVIVGLGVSAVVAYLLCIPYLLVASTNTLTMIEKQTHTPISSTKFVLAEGVSLVVYVVIFSIIGVVLAKRVGLKYDAIQQLFTGKKPQFDKKALWLSLVWGVVGSVLVVLATSLLNKHIQTVDPSSNHSLFIARWKGLLSIFQGGISEEVMLRFGVMTLLVWLLKLIFRQKERMANWTYFISIIASAVVFGLSHLPLAASLYGGLSGWVLTYILVGNGLMGLGFGYLYWKKGLEYAILAHIIGDFMLHVVF